MTITRAARLFVAASLYVASVVGAGAFDFADVSGRAKKLAAASYQEPDGDLPAELKNLNYDQYRDIRFRAAATLWRSEQLPFEAAFFHRGGLFHDAVRINEIVGNSVREIKFDPDRFDYGANKLDRERMRGLGFAGFRLHYPINRASYRDEVAAFLGASYFRALGRQQHYGASARGLAVDTALASGEEFPRFTEFWLARPDRAARQLTFYALLDSPRIAGAYRFVVIPGDDTVIDIKARLFPRARTALVGIAPITSMFFFGENQPFTGNDYRPEVHDSDGLSIRAANGEWIWRPLLNPRHLLVTSFAQANPLGFGLMQRDRKFDHYEDLEARYQARPSVWIEPRGTWGSGQIQLVQIPMPDETNDNIVAFWVSDAPLQPGIGRDFEYRMRWQKNSETLPPAAMVVQTRRGRAFFANHAKSNDKSTSFLIDFDGPALRNPATGFKPGLALSADANGQILASTVYPNDVNGGWRLSLRVRQADAAKAAEVRAQLIGKDKKVSETWSYILPHE